MPVESSIETPIVSESVQALYKRMQDAMIPLVRKHTVAISAYHGGKPHHHATGTLVQFSDHYFLVTAAHAIAEFDEAKKTTPDLRLYLDNGDANDLVPLYGTYQATDTVRDLTKNGLRLPGERDDLWDIGLWELDCLTVDLLTTKKFLNRTSISITANLSSGVYFLAGCPCSWAQTDPSSRSVKWKWLRYIAHIYPERDSLPNFDERFHMAICLGNDPQLPTSLAGISGCAIWKLSDEPVSESWTVDQVKIVAIETCAYPQRAYKAIRGTKWECVLKALTQKRPGIREGFKLWLPGKE